MALRKEIGKIKSIAFGWGGYQDAMIGVSVDLGSDKDSWGVGDFRGAWGTKVDKYTKWTDEERLIELGKTCMWVKGLLSDAKVQTLDKLKGTPVEVTFEGNTLKSWRILTEVI